MGEFSKQLGVLGDLFSATEVLGSFVDDPSNRSVLADALAWVAAVGGAALIGAEMGGVPGAVMGTVYGILVESFGDEVLEVAFEVGNEYGQVVNVATLNAINSGLEAAAGNMGPAVSQLPTDGNGTVSFNLFTELFSGPTGTGTNGYENMIGDP